MAKLKQLESFVSVATRGSLTAAAKASNTGTVCSKPMQASATFTPRGKACGRQAKPLGAGRTWRQTH